MILVIGEALIDLIGDAQNPGEYSSVVGGANANVALALSRRGAAQKFMGRISSDGFGNQIRNRLQSNGVDLSWSIDALEQTTLAVATIDSLGVASYSFYVNGTTDWGWTPKELPSIEKLLAENVQAVQFGCLAMAVGPGNLVLEAWLNSLAESGSFTLSHDLNIRSALGFEKSVELARVSRVNEFSNLIKASDADIEWLYDLPAGHDLDEIATEWAGEEKLVVITRGGDGADLYFGGQKHTVAAPKIRLVDTVGAGDTFMANLLTELSLLDGLGSDPASRFGRLAEKDLLRALDVAAKAAALVCERKGCEPPTEAEVLATLR
jgi:Sugar kinases, ribokinase family